MAEQRRGRLDTSIKFDVTVMKLVQPMATLSSRPNTTQVRHGCPVRLERDNKFGNPLLHIGKAVYKVDDNVRRFFDKFLDEGKLGVELRQPPVNLLFAPPTPKKTRKRSAAAGGAVITAEEENVPLSTVTYRLRSLKRKLRLLNADPFRVDVAVAISDDEGPPATFDDLLLAQTDNGDHNMPRSGSSNDSFATPSPAPRPLDGGVSGSSPAASDGGQPKKGAGATYSKVNSSMSGGSSLNTPAPPPLASSAKKKQRTG